jgi:hypothetical protein
MGLPFPSSRKQRHLTTIQLSFKQEGWLPASLQAAILNQWMKLCA